MEIDNHNPERVANLFEKYLLNFYFFNVDISFTMQDPNLKLRVCIENIVVEGTVSDF